MLISSKTLIHKQLTGLLLSKEFESTSAQQNGFMIRKYKSNSSRMASVVSHLCNTRPAGWLRVVSTMYFIPEFFKLSYEFHSQLVIYRMCVLV